MTLMFCKEPGCNEFAQAEDVTVENVLKFYCVACEKVAIARGESPKRPEYKAQHLDLDAPQHKGEGELPPPRRGPAMSIRTPAPAVAPTEPETPAASMLPPPPAEPAEPPPAPAIERKTMPRGEAPRKVRCIDTGEIFESVGAAAKSVGLSTIGYALAPSAKSNKAGGKQWEWADAGKVNKAAAGGDGAIKFGAPLPIGRKPRAKPARATAKAEAKAGGAVAGVLEKIDEEIEQLEERINKLRKARELLGELGVAL